MASATSTANIIAPTDEANAMSRQAKLLFCSFIGCSAQCIQYDLDSNINNNDVQSKHLALLEKNKMQLRSLAHSLGVKISYRPPVKHQRTC
jgi:hypothetical protein